MNKTLCLALLIAGLILLGFGLNASDSIGSDFSRFFTGSPTDKSMWLIIGGAIAAAAGAGGLLFGAKAR